MKAWLQLLRIPNLPTSASNILMAFLVANASWSPANELLLLIFASCCFYSAGMVLNDVFDLQVDQIERPQRPIASGQIRVGSAIAAVFALFSAGLIGCLFAGILATGRMELDEALPLLHQPMVRSSLLGTLLVVAIWLYDGPLKRTRFASGVMGICRLLNVLLGASTFIPNVIDTNIDPILGLPFPVWWVAISLAILIGGTTLLGRKEAQQSQPQAPLWIATVIIALGFIGFATVVYCPMHTTAFGMRPNSITGYLIFIAFMAFSVGRHVVRAALTATPSTIQTGVVSVLRSLIFIDAFVCLLFGSGQIIFPLTVAALIIPVLFLGRFIRST